jgi:uncharacterized membrane protein YdbT with pleckstrin-like domain
MILKKHGERLSKKLTKIVRSGHVRRIVITDKHNNPVIQFPVLGFVVVTLILPIAVGILIFLFLMSEYHAVVKGTD